MKKAFDQTVRDIKRGVNKKVLKVPSIEQKVLDATSNEPWGPHVSLLADIAQATRNYHEYQMIMSVIWKRVNDTGKNWRHVYKALTVLEYLLANGSERVIEEIREHDYQISTLFDFQYIDSTGRDQGSNVRKKSLRLVALANDKERKVKVRQKAAANRESTSGGGAMYRPGSYAGPEGYDDDRYGGRYGSSYEDRNGYGRERELGDDKYGRHGDSYGRDGDRYGEDRYNRDGYRDEEYRGRSQSVDPDNYGSTSRSDDRDRERAYGDDGQYSQRGSNAKADDRSPDGRGEREKHQRAAMSGVKLENFRIPLDEIKLGTDNFNAENFIGGGGFGKVYKGKLLDSRDHGEVAIKRLDAKSLQGKHEFLNEISLLFSYQHENIITFIGYCDEANEMIVVYEYAINQSLDKYLHDTNKMSTISWEQRLKICIGAAKGLSYLHWGLGEHHRVIHRDIKSANILLDENWVAKISDFGLSKIAPKDLPYTHLHTKVAGTLGYCDPNYYGTDVLRKESDVYSFGVVLFEMLSGRLVYKKRCKEDDEPESLVEWVRCCYKDGLEKIIDPQIRDQIKSKSLSTFNEIAYRCLKMKVIKRPTMPMVVQQLEEALEFQINNYKPDSSSTSGTEEKGKE